MCRGQKKWNVSHKLNNYQTIAKLRSILKYHNSNKQFKRKKIISQYKRMRLFLTQPYFAHHNKQFQKQIRAQVKSQFILDEINPRIGPINNKNKQKKQGKIIAKDARQRKKIYISFLQQQNKSLQQQLRNQKHISLKLAEQIKAYKYKQLQIQRPADTFLLKKQFKKLYQLLKTPSKREVSQSLDYLRENFGISGTKRKAWIHNILEKQISLFMPMHFRLLMEHSQNSSKFYSLLGGNQTMKQFKQHFKQQLTKNIILETRPLILQARVQYQMLIRNLCQLQQQLFKLSQKSQKIINRIEDNFDPFFVGKLLLNLDTQRNKDQQLQNIFPVNYYRSIEKFKNEFIHTIQIDDKCKIQDQELKNQEDNRQERIIKQDYQAYFEQFQCYDDKQYQKINNQLKQ